MRIVFRIMTFAQQNRRQGQITNVLTRSWNMFFNRNSTARLQDREMVSGTKKQQEDKKLILNGPYRIRYKHITNWFYLTMQVTKIIHTPKCTPIYFSAGENWLFIVQFGAHGTFSHVGNIHRYKITPKFMCGKISLYTYKMCWFGWFSCLKT